MEPLDLLKSLTIDLVEACTDADLLDLVYKLLAFDAILQPDTSGSVREGIRANRVYRGKPR